MKMQIKQPCYESTDLDPVVIEYEATVERIRKDNRSIFDAWFFRVARMRPAIRAKVAQLRGCSGAVSIMTAARRTGFEEP